MSTFPKDMFLRPTRKCHIWHRKVHIKVWRKKGLTADLYIDPGIGDERKVILRVKAGLKSKLRARLYECGEDRCLQVETEVTDSAGQGYGGSNFSPHPISSDGSCSFYQELVKCEEMEGCPSSEESSEVTVRIRVTLMTSQREDYTLSDDEEDGYVLVSCKVGAGPQLTRESPIGTNLYHPVV